jgi:hypothetical protein
MFLASERRRKRIVFESMSIELRISAPLDPGFQPAVVFNRNYVAAAKASDKAPLLVIGLEREGGLISRYETVVRPGADVDTLHYVERIVKFLLWARGGWKIYFGGPQALCEHIRKCYSIDGARAFDVDLTGRVYERPFEVVLTDTKSVPAEKEMNATLGGHLDG